MLAGKADPTQKIAEGETRQIVAQALGTNRETLRQDLGLKSDEGSRADDATAKQFGIGRDTMRRELFIADNSDLLDPADFAEWDEGKLSTNKAYQRIKDAKARAERDRVAARTAVRGRG